MSSHPYIRLPLRQTYNTRDLGGYASATGTATRWQAFLRSDEPAHCDREDIDFLLGYGLRTVIDLRTQAECDYAPNPFAQIEGVHYVNIPLGFDTIPDVMALKDPTDNIPSLTKFYLYILEKKQYQVREIMDLMVDRLPHTALFHCVVGKDRTGVIAMLLLALAEVSKADIIANYEVTFSHVSENPRLKKAFAEDRNDLMLSKREFMQPAFDLIQQRFGSAADYLHHIGMTPERVARLKAHLLV